MKTIQLQHAPPELAAVLAVAAQEGVLIEDPQGNQFLLEKADAFDVEVAQLGSSDRFLAFLADRSRETSGKSIEEVAARFGLDGR